MPLGVLRGTVRIEEYDNDWISEFEKEKKFISKVFENNFIDIQHVGSTSISNLCAKPLIDIAYIFVCWHKS